MYLYAGGQPGIYSARFAQDEANVAEHKDLASITKIITTA